MCAAARLCQSIFWIGLTSWFAALAAAGIAAMNVFGTLPEMPMRLSAFAPYPEVEHGRIAAGQVMANVFATVDMVQYAAAPVVIVTLALQLMIFRPARGRLLEGIRGASILTAACLLAWYALALAPPMNELLAAHWAAASSGALEEAGRLRASFEAVHQRADAAFRGELLLLLIAVAASGALSFAPRASCPAADPAGPTPDQP